MSLATELACVLPDIPSELLIDERRIALDAMIEASGGDSQSVIITGAETPQGLREIIQLAGTSLINSDLLSLALIYRRGTTDHYRFEAKWEPSEKGKIARLSILPYLHPHNRSIAKYGVSFKGLRVECFNQRNSLVYPWLFDGNPLPEINERARLLNDLGQSDKGYERFQISLIRDLVFPFMDRI